MLRPTVVWGGGRVWRGEMRGTVVSSIVCEDGSSCMIPAYVRFVNRVPTRYSLYPAASRNRPSNQSEHPPPVLCPTEYDE